MPWREDWLLAKGRRYIYKKKKKTRQDDNDADDDDDDGHWIKAEKDERNKEMDELPLGQPIWPSSLKNGPTFFFLSIWTLPF